MELVPRKRLMLFAGRGNEDLSAEIASCLGVALGDIVLTSFANGEIYCRYGESVRGADRLHHPERTATRSTTGSWSSFS